METCVGKNLAIRPGWLRLRRCIKMRKKINPDHVYPFQVYSGLTSVWRLLHNSWEFKRILFFPDLWLPSYGLVQTCLWALCHWDNNPRPYHASQCLKGWLSSSSHLLTALKRGIQWRLDKERYRWRIKDNGKETVRGTADQTLQTSWCKSNLSLVWSRQWSWDRRVYALWMPTISNAIRQMDQSAPGPDRAKSSWSRDQWISVSPTERGRRVGRMSPHASWSLPFECFPFSFTLNVPSCPRLSFIQ